MTSNVETIIQNILTYYQTTRRVGHTMALLNGVSKSREVVVVVNNGDDGRAVRRRSSAAIVMSVTDLSVAENIDGLKRAILFDNHALFAIFTAATMRFEELYRTIREKDEEIARLKSEAENAASALAGTDLDRHLRP